MDETNTKSTFCQPPLPSGELWRALKRIFDFFFLELLGLHRLLPPQFTPPADVIAAIQLLDCWLDIAEEEGWLAPTCPSED